MIPNDEQRQLGEAAQTFRAEQAGPAPEATDGEAVE